MAINSSAVTWTEAKTEANIAMASRLSEGAYTVTVSEAAEFASYEIGDIDKIYDDSDTNYKKDLVVYGVKSNGSKVVLPTTKYTVTTDKAELSYNAGQLDADGVVILNKDVIVTNKAPKVASAKWVTATNVTVENGVLTIEAGNVGTSSNLTEALELKDQYGEKFVFDGTITFTNLVDANGSDLAANNNGKSNVAIANGAEGDTFTMTLVQGGNAYTIPVVVIS